MSKNNKKQPSNIFRTPKEDEWIEYPCGCIYEIYNVGKHGNGSFEIMSNVFCFEHDPTINDKAKKFGEDNIDWSLV